MNLADLREAIRIDLADIGEVEYTDDEVDRSIRRAVWDISRKLPREKLYSVKIDWSVVGEAVTTDKDQWKQLASTNIQPKSETVTVAATGVVKVRDTDYVMDYAAGEIMALTTGAAWLISYTRNKVAISISTLTDLIRVKLVEFPAGQYPMKVQSHSHWGDFIYLLGGDESQTAPTENDYAVIYYQAYHSLPLEMTAGSYPTFMDEVVIKGGVAYALFIKALAMQHLAKADVESAETALGNLATVHASIVSELANADTHIALSKTALDKVPGEVGKASTALNKVQSYGSAASSAFDAVGGLVDKAEGALAQADGEIAGAIADLVSAAGVWTTFATYIVGSGTTIKGAQPFLKDGLASFINKVTLGADAAELMRRYSDTEVSIAGLWATKAQVYVTSAQIRAQFAQAYIAKAGEYIAGAQARVAEGAGRTNIASAFIAEANQRLESAATYISEATQRLSAANLYISKAVRHGERLDAYLNEADRYLLISQRNLEIAVALKVEATERRAEFESLLDDRAQYMKDKSLVSVRQYAR